MASRTGFVDRSDFALAGYWPALAVALGSVVLVAFQLQRFPRIPVSLLSVVLDAVFAVILLGGVAVVQPMREAFDLYWPFMAGTTLVHVFGVVEILDEVVRQPFWFDFLFGDVTAPLGALFLFLGLRRWVAVQAAQRRALEEQTAELTRRAERLDEFAGVISHDIRNPLALAKARLEVVRSDPEDTGEHLAVIGDALERIGTIVDDTLTLAREGRTVTDPEPVDTAALAHECWRTAVGEDGPATLEVSVEHTIAADPARLRQVFENLFRNALEHAGPDAAVTVGELPESEGAGFYVADDGPGVPESEREDVLDAGYTDAEEGTGFGLAIVAGIAEAHGWEVTVAESEAGGARFEFRGVEAAGRV
jgi:signal transduction histidine kinase